MTFALCVLAFVFLLVCWGWWTGSVQIDRENIDCDGQIGRRW